MAESERTLDADADTEQSPDMYDLSVVDSNIYSLWNSIASKPTAEDIEASMNDDATLPAMTTRKEILGWLIWDFSNGPQWQVFMALCWTVFLVQNATEYACTNSMEYGCDLYHDPINTDQIVTVNVAGSQLVPESFYFITVAFSGVLQLIAYVMVGGLMDYGQYQFYIFIWCSIIGALFDAPYIFLSDPGSFMFAGFWTAIGIVFYGVATIAYNSMLVDLAENHWLVRRVDRMKLTVHEKAKVHELIVDDLSNFGTAGSYTGSLVMTLVAALLFTVLTDTTYTLQEGYGQTDGMDADSVYEEAWAKNVYGAKISYLYDTTMSTESHVVSVQLFYDDIGLNGTQIGSGIVDTTSNANLQIKEETFRSENDAINTILLWYNGNNEENGIAAMQFKTVSGAESGIFGGVDGDVSSLTQSEAVTVRSDEDGFLFAGYNVYMMQNADDIAVIGGFDFLFLSPDGQWESTLSLRVVIMAVFLFWFVPQIYTFCTMQKRTKPPLPADQSVWTISVKGTWKTLSETFKQYPHIRRALIAWFFYSDAIGTSMSTSILFARIELGFSFVELILLLLEFEVACAVGGVLHLWVQKKINWNCRQMMLYHLVFYSCLTVYILLGLIPNIPFGLVNKWEMWMAVIVYGMNAASLVGFGRALTSNLIPEGKENEMFSLFAITDKGSSWIGPAIMGVFANLVGIRWPLLYVLMFFLASIPLIYYIDMEEGLQQAGRIDSYHDEDDEDDEDKDKDGRRDSGKKLTQKLDANPQQLEALQSHSALSETTPMSEQDVNSDGGQSMIALVSTTDQ